MEDLPDFHALAELWLARHPRSQDLDSNTRASIVARMAAALENRRNSNDGSEEEIGLIVNIDRDSMSTENGLAEEAIDKLTQFLQERIDQDHGV